MKKIIMSFGKGKELIFIITIPQKDYERLLERANRSDKLEFLLAQYQAALIEAEKQIYKMSGIKVIDDS